MARLWYPGVGGWISVWSAQPFGKWDFPGGWKNDKINKFEAAGRTPKDNEIYELVKKLANFRKSSSAITSGKLMQYIPADGVYTYFRYDEKQTIMVVMNASKTEKEVDPAAFEERTQGLTNYTNILNGEKQCNQKSVFFFTFARGFSNGQN